MRMTVLASGSKGNSAIIAAGATRILVDAGLSCRELLRRMAVSGEDPEELTAILITHEHLDHVAGLAVLARRLNIPVFFTEPTHRAWVRQNKPRTTMTYAKWMDMMAAQREARAAETLTTFTRPEHMPAHTLAASAIATAELPQPAVLEPEAYEAIASLSAAVEAATPEPLGSADPGPCEADDSKSTAKADPTFLPAVEYFRAGRRFCIGEIDIDPFTIPHDAADPCGFVFHARTETIRMAIATDLGYVPPNVKLALRNVDVLLLESNHDLEMLKDGPYPWSVKQRVLSRVGHLSNDATAEFLLRDYDGGAHTIVLGHLSEQNNLPDLARYAAERAIGDRLTLLGNRVVLALQETPLAPINL